MGTNNVSWLVNIRHIFYNPVTSQYDSGYLTYEDSELPPGSPSKSRKRNIWLIELRLVILLGLSVFTVLWLFGTLKVHRNKTRNEDRRYEQLGARFSNVIQEIRRINRLHDTDSISSQEDANSEYHNALLASRAEDDQSDMSMENLGVETSSMEQDPRTKFIMLSGLTKKLIAKNSRVLRDSREFQHLRGVHDHLPPQETEDESEFDLSTLPGASQHPHLIKHTKKPQQPHGDQDNAHDNHGNAHDTYGNVQVDHDNAYSKFHVNRGNTHDDHSNARYDHGIALDDHDNERDDHGDAHDDLGNTHDYLGTAHDVQAADWVTQTYPGLHHNFQHADTVNRQKF